ncbi:MAG: DNA gyrase C-terminal beta-propeller domain-containing protein, partial [Pseudomonadota bacterium]
LMVDIPQETEIVDLLIHVPGRKLLLASSAGDGFVVPEDEMLASKRAGKQVLNVKPGVAAKAPVEVMGDHVVCVGENRKMLVFPLAELPEMPRGKGVRLQKFKDGGLSDVTTVTLAEGLKWADPAGRTRHEPDLSEWVGGRAQAGRMAPRGFPRNNRFT